MLIQCQSVELYRPSSSSLHAHEISKEGLANQTNSMFARNTSKSMSCPYIDITAEEDKRTETF